MGLGAAAQMPFNFERQHPVRGPTDSGGWYAACFLRIWHLLPISWAGDSPRKRLARVQRKSLHRSKQFGTYVNASLQVALPVEWFVHAVGKLSRRVELP